MAWNDLWSNCVENVLLTFSKCYKADNDKKMTLHYKTEQLKEALATDFERKQYIDCCNECSVILHCEASSLYICTSNWHCMNLGKFCRTRKFKRNS